MSGKKKTNTEKAREFVKANSIKDTGASTTGCPPALPGYSLTDVIWVGESCWCVYENDNDPTDFYMRPCL